jgi:hypothetical protein
LWTDPEQTILLFNVYSSRTSAYCFEGPSVLSKQTLNSQTKNNNELNFPFWYNLQIVRTLCMMAGVCVRCLECVQSPHTTVMRSVAHHTLIEGLARKLCLGPALCDASHPTRVRLPARQREEHNLSMQALSLHTIGRLTRRSQREYSQAVHRTRKLLSCVLRPALFIVFYLG